MRFEELALSQPVLRAVSELGYRDLTPIQEKAVPLALAGHDLLGTAQTGTGKTAAFSLPIVELLSAAHGTQRGRRPIRALIVTPTRELAIQIGESIDGYAKHTPLRSTVIFGGVNQGPQATALSKGIDILVATPGRLLDLMSQGLLSLDSVRHFVLDEADRMLDMGFVHDIRKLLKVLPADRQSLFFSATMPKDIVELSSTVLRSPRRVSVAPVSSTADTIEQYLYPTNKAAKKDLLLYLLRNGGMDRVLVFAATKHGADKVARLLDKEGVGAAAIHGNKSQAQRQKALSRFKDNAIRVLVATDIAARGIDIDKLRYVINYDIPNVAETYVHRIGRSGRAGEEGVALSMCGPEENAYVRDIEKLLGRKIPLATDNPYPQTDRPMTVAEKKEYEKEKLRKKKEFFANKGKPSTRSSPRQGKSRQQRG